MYIEIKDAVKKYGEGENEIFAMDGVNLDISEHEICVILGPSGSGKSTLLNMLGGIDTLTSGSIVVNGRDISGMNKKELTAYRRSDIGFIFQSYNLIQDLTVKENIQTVADISGEPLDIDELLESLSLTKYKDHFPSELSGGQQQRTAIARALVKNPAILLCDEPTGALDSKSSRDVLRMLDKVNNIYKTTVIIITHNEGISKMADRVIRIHDGKIVKNVMNESRTKVEDLEI
ncbi:MAG: ABC transporter ATP-binding protein [Lachnospiraceae bacterium]|nr:ABC transporter ATP-binding protein [Lachnospiraceae bacterium]